MYTLYVQVLRSMGEGGAPKPSIITYNSTIKALGNCGNWREVLNIWDELRAGGLSPDVIT